MAATHRRTVRSSPPARGEQRPIRTEGESPDDVVVASANRRLLARSRVKDRDPLRAVIPGTRQSCAVRAHDEGSDIPVLRHGHATKNPTGFVEHVNGRVPDPRSYPKAAVGLGNLDIMHTFGAQGVGEGGRWRVEGGARSCLDHTRFVGNRDS